MLLKEYARLLRTMVASTVENINDSMRLPRMIKLYLLMQMSHEYFKDLRVSVALYTGVVDVPS